jgi:hypothetical protein
MPRGGCRAGAGRKRGAGNLLTEGLRERIDAPRLIRFLQDVADGKIAGASVGERKDAAATLLKKVLPDCKQADVAIESQPAVIVVKSNIPEWDDNIKPEHVR